MVHLRDRLAEAESAREAAEERASLIPSDRGADEDLRARVEQLEAGVQAARVPAPTVLGPVACADDLRAQVEERLCRQGYERVTFLEGAEGGLLVEAERGGVTAKGRAEIRPDGSVRLQSVSSLRAFP